jgi:transcriptional regulator with XRE-family HTH domain
VDIAQKIKQLRLQLNLQQQETANFMGLTRQTYALVESGKKDLTLPELEKLAGFLHSSLVEMLYGSRIIDETALRMGRYSQILLNTCFYGANEWGAMTKLKLSHLVYLIDLEWYRQHGTSMIGGPYLRYINGPIPDHFYWVVDMLYEQGQLAIEHKGAAVLVSTVEKPSQRDLEPQEIKFIKEMARKWQNTSTGDLATYVARQVSWKHAHNDMFVPYELLKPKDAQI